MPLDALWFHWNRGWASALDTLYLLPVFGQFRDITLMFALQTACRMDLFEIARARGIQTEFLDGQGHRRVTDEAALKIVLESLPQQTPGALIGQPVVVRVGKSARATLLPGAKL